MKHRYFIELAYNGTRFHGWQIQPNATSVQEVLEKALSMMCREEIQVTGAGRTDAGVHASYFVAHFDSDNDKIDPGKLAFSLNRYLGPDMVIFRIVEVDSSLHARFGAVSRTYRYFINSQKNPFRRETSWFFPRNLDLVQMNTAGELITSYRDFTSFSKLHTDVKTNNCEVRYARWTKQGTQLCFEICADRFLRNMVRAIVGTLVDVGLNKLSPEDVGRIIEQKDRGQAGTSVPACGLFLVDIAYPTEQFIRFSDSLELF